MRDKSEEGRMTVRSQLVKKMVEIRVNCTCFNVLVKYLYESSKERREWSWVLHRSRRGKNTPLIYVMGHHKFFFRDRSRSL